MNRSVVALRRAAAALRLVLLVVRIPGGEPVAAGAGAPARVVARGR